MDITNTLNSFKRFIVVWFVNAIALLFTIWLLPGFRTLAILDSNPLVTASAGALILGIVNFIIRPLVLLLSVPFGMFVVFIIGLFVNTLSLMITASLLPTFEISDWGWAFLGSFVFSAFNILINNILTIDDDQSFYQGLIERLAKRHPYEMEKNPGRGLVMMEIDGLSYHHIQKALADGWMPNVQRLIEEKEYKLSHVDCGLPSQTSACQAGIMFGDNFDIPAFRWFDKDRNKLMVSGSDASEINARYAKGNGLMRSGTSISNMMNGDAMNSILTLADLHSGSPEANKQRANDIYLLMLDPYFFIRTIILFLGDVLLELWQGFRQRLRNEQPRLNRLHKAYPFLRATTTVFMRDIAANLLKMEIIRGSPSLYLTWPGYDEVAHHSGPWTDDAFRTLRQYDQVIGRIYRTIREKAPRPYDLILLSDHGQSTGATFLQRYGYDLKTLIQNQMPAGTQSVQVSGGDDGTPVMGAMAVELENVNEQGYGSRIGKVLTQQTAKLLHKGATIRSAEIQTERPGNVTVCGSGNLAQVYFDLYPRRITQQELDKAYLGMIKALTQHEGVGFVVTYDKNNTPFALGRAGQRNLHTGEVKGLDPLDAYGDADFRAEQVRRIADFPHAGDLIVNSTQYPDGSVAAMEELIGNHGGLGGEQTDAFLLHPLDMDVPPTSNSADVFSILNQRRGMPNWAQEPQVTPEQSVPSWHFSTLFQGLRSVKSWIPLMFRAIALQWNAYKEIAQNPNLTGPALLLGVIGTIILAWTRAGHTSWGTVPLQLIVWLINILLLFLAGRFLRGKGTYTSILRVSGFAHSVYLLDGLVLIPGFEPIITFVVSLLAFFTSWVGAAVAHELKGWRILILPLVNILAFMLGAILLYTIIGGFVLSFESIAIDFGLLSKP